MTNADRILAALAAHPDLDAVTATTVCAAADRFPVREALQARDVPLPDAAVDLLRGTKATLPIWLASRWVSAADVLDWAAGRPAPVWVQRAVVDAVAERLNLPPWAPDGSVWRAEDVIELLSWAVRHGSLEVICRAAPSVSTVVASVGGARATAAAAALRAAWVDGLQGRWASCPQYLAEQVVALISTFAMAADDEQVVGMLGRLAAVDLGGKSSSGALVTAALLGVAPDTRVPTDVAEMVLTGLASPAGRATAWSVRAPAPAAVEVLVRAAPQDRARLRPLAIAAVDNVSGGPTRSTPRSTPPGETVEALAARWMPGRTVVQVAHGDWVDLDQWCGHLVAHLVEYGAVDAKYGRGDDFRVVAAHHGEWLAARVQAAGVPADQADAVVAAVAAGTWRGTRTDAADALGVTLDATASHRVDVRRVGDAVLGFVAGDVRRLEVLLAAADRSGRIDVGELIAAVDAIV